MKWMYNDPIAIRFPYQHIAVAYHLTLSNELFLIVIPYN